MNKLNIENIYRKYFILSFLFNHICHKSFYHFFVIGRSVSLHFLTPARVTKRNQKTINHSPSHSNGESIPENSNVLFVLGYLRLDNLIITKKLHYFQQS